MTCGRRYLIRTENKKVFSSKMSRRQCGERMGLSLPTLFQLLVRSECFLSAVISCAQVCLLCVYIISSVFCFGGEAGACRESMNYSSVPPTRNWWRPFDCARIPLHAGRKCLDSSFLIPSPLKKSLDRDWAEGFVWYKLAISHPKLSPLFHFFPRPFSENVVKGTTARTSI